MGTNCIVFGWNRPIPGREEISASHFEEFLNYLAGMQQAGTIHSFDTVFLSPHGGDMNGFFLIRGETSKLDALVSSTEWVTHMTRANLHLEGSGAVRGNTGEAVDEMFGIWSSNIPK